MARAHSGCGSSATTRAPSRRKLPGAIADMGADVEGEIAGAHEAGVERIHRRVALRVAVVHVERAAQGCESRVGAESG